MPVFENIFIYTFVWGKGFCYPDLYLGWFFFSESFLLFAETRWPQMTRLRCWAMLTNSGPVSIQRTTGEAHNRNLGRQTPAAPLYPPCLKKIYIYYMLLTFSVTDFSFSTNYNILPLQQKSRFHVKKIPPKTELMFSLYFVFFLTFSIKQSIYSTF